MGAGAPAYQLVFRAAGETSRACYADIEQSEDYPGRSAQGIRTFFVVISMAPPIPILHSWDSDCVSPVSPTAFLSPLSPDKPNMSPTLIAEEGRGAPQDLVLLLQQPVPLPGLLEFRGFLLCKAG